MKGASFGTMPWRCLVLVCLLVQAMILQAQSVQLNGYVQDAASGEMLPGATLWCAAESVGAGTQALESLPFEVQQEIWGEDLEEALESGPRLELVALSPEMVLFYRRLDEVRNGGGLFFSEPILAYSNVSSGYGCFGLYTSTAIDLD